MLVLTVVGGFMLGTKLVKYVDSQSKVVAQCSFETNTCYESVELRQQAEAYQDIANQVFGK
jgi:hypothetical protein